MENDKENVQDHSQHSIDDDDSSDGNKELVDFETLSLTLLQQITDNQNGVARQIANMEEQNVFLYQQMLQLFGGVTTQLKHSEAVLQIELQQFQTGGPQRAMASVFYKLFRDLLKHINQLDELVKTSEVGNRHDNELAWIEALSAARDSFESILTNWGCHPMVIKVGEELFDPEFHEAVAAESEEIPDSVPENVIVAVRRRGWKLQDYILQYPLVVVS